MSDFWSWQAMVGKELQTLAEEQHAINGRQDDLQTDVNGLTDTVAKESDALITPPVDTHSCYKVTDDSFLCLNSQLVDADEYLKQQLDGFKVNDAANLLANRCVAVDDNFQVCGDKPVHRDTAMHYASQLRIAKEIHGVIETARQPAQ